MLSTKMGKLKNNKKSSELGKKARKSRKKDDTGASKGDFFRNSLDEQRVGSYNI
jgi:hypothetical protein